MLTTQEKGVDCEKTFEKYYGERMYKERQLTIDKKYFSSEDKSKMLRNITDYIRKKISLYHDLMDNICESNEDWFNLLTFDKQSRQFVLTYLKSKNRYKYR